MKTMGIHASTYFHIADPVSSVIQPLEPHRSSMLLGKQRPRVRFAVFYTYLEVERAIAILFYVTLSHKLHTQEKGMKRISVNVPDNMYDALNDLASQHHVPMSLYTRMLLRQAFHIGPELEEVKKRVDELQSCMHGFMEAILEDEP